MIVCNYINDVTTIFNQSCFVTGGVNISPLLENKFIIMVIINPRLDLFTEPDINYSNKDYTIASYDPIYAVVPDNPITFVINGDTSFMNLSESLLRFKIKVVQHNGASLTAGMTGHVALSNFAFASVFKSIKVKINGYDITPRSDLYAYKAYIEHLFSSSPNTTHKDTLVGWDSNAGYDQDNVTGGNPAFGRRASKCNLSSVQELVGRPFVDLFKCNRNILPRVKLEVTLYPNPNTFVIQHDNTENVTGKHFQYRLSDVQLFIRKEEVNSDTSELIEKRLQYVPAKYFYPVSTIKQQHIMAGSYQFRADDLFQNRAPVKLLATFVHTEAFAGSYRRDPFWFSPTENIESIEFFKNGVKLGHQRPVEINLAENNADTFLHYIDLLTASGANEGTEGLNFPPESMRLGNFFAAVDCTPDGEEALSHRYPISSGNISVYVKFRHALVHDLDFFIYAVFNETLEINSQRQVISSVV